MSLLGNIGYILLGFIGIILVFLIILAVLEKRLHVKFLRGKYRRNEFYIERISKVNINNPLDSVRNLERTSKSFFTEAFHIKGNPEFSELANIFARKNNKKATEFCMRMTHFLYANQKIDTKELQNLIQLLAEIISSNKILSEDTQKELDKKSKKLDPNNKKLDLDKLKKLIKKN